MENLQRIVVFLMVHIHAASNSLIVVTMGTHVGKMVDVEEDHEKHLEDVQMIGNAAKAKNVGRI